MNVILDTNIWISFLMGKRLHNVADIFERSDPKDVYLLSMADAIPADFIVTGDYDLLTLGKYNRTPILSFSDFMQVLSGLS